MQRHRPWHCPGMSNTAALILSLHASDAPTGDAPEWLHLMPAGTFSGVDGRGPYVADDPAALVALFSREARRLPLDENHSIDLAGKKGQPSPARGWIVEMEARDDGVWGRVEWTDEGRQMVAGHAYGYLSPVFFHTPARPFRVSKILRAALTNDPNLTDLKSLHTRTDQMLLDEIRAALGLPDDADEAAALAAVVALHAAQAAHTSTIARVAAAAGVAPEAGDDVLVTAIQSRGATDADDLRRQVVSLQTQLVKLATDTARDKAEAVIDAAISGGRLVPALRDHMITRHTRNPAEVEQELALMPSINAGGLGGHLPPARGDSLTHEDAKVMAMMGVDADAYKALAKTLYGKGG